MPSFKKQTIYPNIAQAGSDANFYDIPCTINCRRMEITETPPASAGNQGQYAPQGLQYQLYEPTTKSWGPTIQLLPGDTLVIGDQIPEGKGRGPIIGWRAQAIAGGAGQGASTYNRPADTPVRIMSGTATTTQVLVTEYA